MMQIIKLILQSLKNYMIINTKMSVPAYQQFNSIRYCNNKLKSPRPKHGELFTMDLRSMDMNQIMHICVLKIGISMNGVKLEMFL